jgi:hypothetical protein
MNRYDRATLRDMARWAIEARDRKDARWELLLKRLQERTGLSRFEVQLNVYQLALRH